MNQFERCATGENWQLLMMDCSVAICDSKACRNDPFESLLPIQRDDAIIIPPRDILVSLFSILLVLVLYIFTQQSLVMF